MPSRASTPFLLRWLQFVTIVNIGVSMPFRASAPFLLTRLWCVLIQYTYSINALSGWGSISTHSMADVKKFINDKGINALSDWCSISTLFYEILRIKTIFPYQCPLGLMLHFYPLNGRCQEIYKWQRYQCPLGLMLHFYLVLRDSSDKDDFSVSMPSRADAPFLPQKNREEVIDRYCRINALSGWDSISTRLSIWQEFKPKKVSMPFRAGAPFLRQTQ